MSKLNCWESQYCIGCDGNCPARKAEKFDGINSGKNGGRICWYAAATMSDRAGKAAHARKCAECGFFSQVEKEEGSNLVVFF